LAKHLVDFFACQTGKPITGFTPAALAALAQHSWPGNVRELRNAIERGVILSQGPLIDLPHLPVGVTAKPSAAQRVEVGGAVTLKRLEEEHIRRVLAWAPSLDEAAAILGINPSTLYRKRKDLEL
jgi:NtrC-family two-component system response regulator AlgB